MNALRRGLAWLLVASFFLPPPAMSQSPPATSPPPAMAPEASKSFKAEELDQLVAPIALHPDPLLAQILMASTYPLEVVQAARFVKENSKLQGDQLNEELKKHSWDDSVKSMVFFPQVLSMMNEKLDWLQKLGDAFLSQQKELMAAIQRLRARAQASGQLQSTAEQRVIVEAAAAPTLPPPEGSPPAPPPPGSAPPPVVTTLPAPTTTVVEAPAPTVIKIEPADPQVIYVPSYNPTVVYGAWPYPAYPPYYPYPPGYFAAGAFTFAAGMAVGAAVWGNCDWNGGDVNINNSVSNNFSNNVNNRQEARNRVEQRQSGSGQGRAGQNRSNWQHNPDHRKGVQYRDTGTQQRFNKSGPANAQSREAFRGRSGQGSDFSRASQQGGLGQQGGGRADRGAQATSRGQGAGGGGGRQAGAFEGMGSGGRDAQSFSNRGNASRQSYSRSTGGGSGGARASGGGGGGGSRGGGGGGRGGGRR